MNQSGPVSVAPLHVRRLVLMGYAALGAFAVWYWTATKWPDDELNLLAIGMLILGVWPTLRWLGRHDATYPLIETLLLTTIPFYALPLITEHEAIVDYPIVALRQAAGVILTFQLACIAGSMLAAKSYTSRPHGDWWRMELVPEHKLKFTAHTMTLMTVWLLVSTFTDWIPQDWLGTFRAIFYGLGILSTFIQARVWGGGDSTLREKVLFCCNLGCQLILTFSTLLLIYGISSILIALVGFFSSARRVPWLPCVILLPVLAVLHNGKSRMREIYWQEGAPAVGITDLPPYFTQWFQFGLQAASQEDSARHSTALTFGLMRRASLYQIVCVTTNIIPDRAPFLDGESYRLIPAQILPRFVWPNKPSPNDSMKVLAIHLGILTREEAEYTSIGFGMVAESYANFGYVSVAGLGILLGFGLRRLAVSTVACATLSLPGIFRILCMAWCLSAETTLAVWLSSLYQACVAILVPLFLWKYLTSGGPGADGS